MWGYPCEFNEEHVKTNMRNSINPQLTFDEYCPTLINKMNQPPQMCLGVIENTRFWKFWLHKVVEDFKLNVLGKNKYIWIRNEKLPLLKLWKLWFWVAFKIVSVCKPKPIFHAPFFLKIWWHYYDMHKNHVQKKLSKRELNEKRIDGQNWSSKVFLMKEKLLFYIFWGK
jgi:hypothetical protein